MSGREERTGEATASYKSRRPLNVTPSRLWGEERKSNFGSFYHVNASAAATVTG